MLFPTPGTRRFLRLIVLEFFLAPAGSIFLASVVGTGYSALYSCLTTI